ncbi:unnamed protein product, partial [marine sediment metagenome]
VAGLFLILAALIVHIAHTFKTALDRIPRRQGFRPEDESRSVDPTALERDATTAATDGHFVDAIRLLLRAALLRLTRADERGFSHGLTNREHLRRYRGTALFEPMSLLVDTADAKWYGTEVCRPSDYERCCLAHGRILWLIQEPAHAHNA